MGVSEVISVRAREDRFVLLELLGRGGAGEVWRARREGAVFPDEVCLKRPLGALDAEQRRSVIEEARVLARIRHANVVSLLDVVESRDGAPLLIMELVEGVDLRVLQRSLALRGERLSPSAVASVGGSLCRALAAASRAVAGGLVHRDVSPHNVLVSREGEVKLADFGVARAFDRDRWTAAGRIKGKSGYVAPEAVAGAPLDARSDLFSVGVLLYELLANRRPFEASRASSTLAAIARGRFVPLLEAAPEVPGGLASVVERLLARDPDDRPSSADYAARLLADHSEGDIEPIRLRATVRRLREPGPATSVAPGCPASATTLGA